MAKLNQNRPDSSSEPIELGKDEIKDGIVHNICRIEHRIKGYENSLIESEKALNAKNLTDLNFEKNMAAWATFRAEKREIGRKMALEYGISWKGIVRKIDGLFLRYALYWDGVNECWKN